MSLEAIDAYCELHDLGVAIMQGDHDGRATADPGAPRRSGDRSVLEQDEVAPFDHGLADTVIVVAARLRLSEHRDPNLGRVGAVARAEGGPLRS